MPRSTLLVALLIGSLPGCAASVSISRGWSSSRQARSARAEAMREHAQLVQLEARLFEMEQRLASQARACRATPDPRSVAGASPPDPPRTEPLRSEGDFLLEARAVAPAAPPAAKIAVAESPQPVAASSEREHVQQLLEGLREYTFDPQSGLSLERREALRVLLRRERQLDSVNPWGPR